MLQISKFVKSNGTYGGILMSVRDIAVEDINLKEPVFIYFDELPVPFFIQSLQKRGTSKAIVHLNDVFTLEDAEEIVGRDVFIEGEWEDDDEEDFTGWMLLNRGEPVGEIEGIEPIPGNLCIYVGDTLIPLHEDFIISADPERRELNLDLPEGLI